MRLGQAEGARVGSVEMLLDGAQGVGVGGPNPPQELLGAALELGEVPQGLGKALFCSVAMGQRRGGLKVSGMKETVPFEAE